jgi:hypothetical protein
MLELQDGAYPVLDISLRGLRIRHFSPVRPDLGARITGTLHFPDQRPPLPLEGIIIRVQAADVAIRCEEGALPAQWVLEEVARSEAEARFFPGCFRNDDGREVARDQVKKRR